MLLVELLIAVGILAGVYKLATRPGDRMAEVEPDRRPQERRDGPFTADDLVAIHLPAGLGYRKVDVDRLLDRIARQLPRAVYEPGDDTGDEPDRHGEAEDRVSLTKEPGRG